MILNNEVVKQCNTIGYEQIANYKKLIWLFTFLSLHSLSFVENSFLLQEHHLFFSFKISFIEENKNTADWSLELYPNHENTLP